MKFIKPIYNSSSRVLNNMLDLNVNKGSISTQENPIITQELNISIGVTGDLEGNIFFSLPEELALNIVEEMSGMPTESIDSFATSAIAELANIISGNSITELNKQNYQCNISPPQIISGAKNQVSVATEEIIILPLKTELGDFIVNISLATK